MPSRRTFLTASLSAFAAPAWAEADGDYRAALALAYGAPVDPGVAHRQALATVRVAQARADVLLRAQGFKTGAVGMRLRALAQDPRWIYPDDDAGRDRAVADMNHRIATLRPHLPEAFGDLPIAEAQVRRMSRSDEAAGRGGYREAARDGKPGAYYVDLKAIRERPAWTLPSAAFHEVTPGHLLQLPLQSANAPAGAYFEAWAIYAEQLAADLGAYAGDPLGEIGYLQWRLFRIGRIVVDTGLHAMGWTRDRAIAAMTEMQGRSIAFITLEADVDRMAATPGKYAAEGLGALALAAWRPRDRVRWPAFHKAVLVGGPAPFSELQRRIQA